MLTNTLQTEDETCILDEEALVEEALAEEDEEEAEEVESPDGGPKKEINRWYKKECFSCHVVSNYKAKQRPEHCPHCGIEFWDKPSDEYKLFVIQKQFFESDRDHRIMTALFLGIKDYAANMIKGRAKRTRIFTKTYIEEKSMDAATIIIEQFLKNPEYRIKMSFGGCLNRVLNGVMYKEQTFDRHMSLNQPMFSGTHELQDSLGRIGLAHHAEKFMYDQTPFAQENACSSELYGVIDKISNTLIQVQSTEASLSYLLILKHKLSKKRVGFIEAFYKSFGYEHRENFEKAEIVIRRFLKDNR